MYFIKKCEKISLFKALSLSQIFCRCSADVIAFNLHLHPNLKKQKTQLVLFDKYKTYYILD